MFLRRSIVLLSIALSALTGYSQESKKNPEEKEKKKRLREFERAFQFSLFPGISSNGIHSGSYYNKYSLNLFGGLSAGNRVLEVGLVSNLNLKASTGIQFAGLANIVGSNAFINLTQSEERVMISDGFESNMKGIQFAGFMNYVRTHATGIQVSGGFNVVGFNFKGVQITGIGNSAGGTSAGLQLAGVYNFSQESMGGLQISSFFNYTDGQLAGIQLALINKAQHITGRKSTPPTRLRGMQLGLLNFSKAMDGLQIGLINFGGNARGMQIGLINFFSRYPSKELVRMGTPIGLLNFGSKGSYFRFYFNELFSTNIEYTTGNCMNCSHVMETEMPFHDDNKIFNQNALILGYDHFRKTWGFGYGFQKVLYNKVSVAPKPGNERRVITYGIRLLHLNRDMSFDNAFNLLNRFNLDYGIRWRSTYIFAGISLNYFLHEPEDERTYEINSFRISTGELFGLSSKLWPGYGIGIQL